MDVILKIWKLSVIGLYSLLFEVNIKLLGLYLLCIAAIITAHFKRLPAFASKVQQKNSDGNKITD